MIKVNIFNVKDFFKTVNQGTGRVMMLSSGGTKTNIARQDAVQQRLQEQYLENGKCLPLTLEFDNPKDFMSVVSYYAGDC